MFVKPPPYLFDLRRKTLDLGEPGIRIIDAETGQHVASVLPDHEGFFDLHCAKVMVVMVDQHHAH